MEIQQSKPKRLYPRTTVERCLALSIGAFRRPVKGKLIYLSNINRELCLGFRFVRGKLEIHYPLDNKVKSQTIILETQKVGFGQRRCFYCPLCHSLRHKLYLRPDASATVWYFACRKCLELTYELQSINKRGSYLARLNYLMNRNIRLDELKLKIKRKVYDDKFTRPMLRWAKGMYKWSTSPQAMAMAVEHPSKF